MNPALRTSAAHVIVDDIDVLALDRDDEHHLLRVMRLRDGETVTVTDGLGAWRRAEVDGRTLRAVGPVEREPEPRGCTIATAIPKGDRLEWMVQKLTEVGVTEIRLVHFERSVVRWKNDRVVAQLERLRRVAREAAMQSRRVWMPAIVGPVAAADVLAAAEVCVADPDGSPGPVGSFVVIGPEGGFTEAELALAGRRVSLGDTVLRVETAALVAAVRSLSAR